jgi:DNA-binding Xre family transcriptional regulator
MKAKSHFNRMLGSKIAKEDRKISLIDVANEAGVSRKTLETTWTSGQYLTQVHIPTAYKLCRYFDCGLCELISFDK